MKRISLIGLLVVLIIQSCATSNSVSGGFIQKRKYTKGFHIAKRGKVNSVKEKVRSDEYSYRGDSRKKLSLRKAQELQGKSDLFESNRSENHFIFRKKEGDKEERESEMDDENVSYNPNNGVEDQGSEESNRNLSKISNDREKSRSTLGIEKKYDGESEVSDSVRIRSEIIQGLSLASLVFSAIGFFFICFWFFYWGTFESVVIFWGLGLVFFLAALIFLVLQSKEASRSDRLWVFISGAAASLPVIIVFITVVSLLIILSV